MADSSKYQNHAKKADYYDDPKYTYANYWIGREYEQAAEKMAINRLLEGKHFRHAVDIGGGYGRLRAVRTATCLRRRISKKPSSYPQAADAGRYVGF
jgi:hypothetical protein